MIGRAGVSSRLSTADLAREALAGMVRKPVRAMLTALGTVLGVGAFVSTLGLTTTAATQISSHFDALRATVVVLADGEPDSEDGPAFPGDIEGRLYALNGVRSAGLLWTVDKEAAVRAAPAMDAEHQVLSLFAASPGGLTALRPTMASGRLFDDFHNRRGERVAVVGSGAARRLGIGALDNAPAVFLGDVAFTVIGIVEDVVRNGEILVSVVVPDMTAGELWGADSTEAKSVVIDTQPGAAQLIGRQAPVALRPQDPGRIVALVPPDPRNLRTQVESDVNTLFLLLAGVSLVIGAIGISNTTLVSVLERVPEIGLRRALGARRRHIALQFLAESAVLGASGGAAGAAVGLVCVVTVAALRSWTAVVAPEAVAAGPLLGVASGLLAGVYPAVRAARVEPTSALRS